MGGASKSLGEGLGDLATDVVDDTTGIVGDALVTLLELLVVQIKLLVPLVTLLGAVGDLTSAISDVTSGAFKSFVKDPLSFLGCEEDPKCNTVTIYSLWNGSKVSGKPGISGVMDSMKNSVDSVTGVVDAVTGTPDDIENILNETLGEFQNLFNNPNCDSGPNSAKECGPPTTKYMNTGGGSGASGNVIVSVTGEVLGYDPIDFGTGYSKNTTASY